MVFNRLIWQKIARAKITRYSVYSYGKLAAFLKCSKSFAWSMLNDDHCNITVENFLLICRYLEINPVEYLVVQLKLLQKGEQAMIKSVLDIIQSAETFYVLDTETTGLHEGEICQIAIIDNAGKVWFDNLVKTKNPIPITATDIHGITNEMVKEAPTWNDIAHTIQNFLQGSVVCIYNAVYDRKMMHQSDDLWSLPAYAYKQHAQYLCIMEAYAEFYGDWNSFHQSYRWQRLSKAARDCGVPVENVHDALGDCKMTLGVINHMLQWHQERAKKRMNGNTE